MLSLLAVLFALALAAGAASAEVVRNGSLLVVADGDIAPAELPRSRAVPVGVRLQGRVRTLDGSALPRLRRFAISINRNASLRAAGVPRCGLEQVRDKTATAALAACGAALVGRGRFGALVDLPDQPQLRANGRLYAFNSRYRGRPAIIAHVHAPRPAQTSVTFPIRIRRTLGGPYGLTFVAPLTGRLGATIYATDFTLNLGGRFAAPGPNRRYLSASCPAPRGFPLVTFPLARAAFNFEGNRRVIEHLTRSCRVRRR